jgi:hypothetical protein
LKAAVKTFADGPRRLAQLTQSLLQPEIAKARTKSSAGKRA